jgi:hypothetical protein
LNNKKRTNLPKFPGYHPKKRKKKNPKLLFGLLQRQKALGLTMSMPYLKK